jgi:hypothetical protein
MVAVWRTVCVRLCLSGEDPCDLMHNVPDKCKNRPELQRPKPGDCERWILALFQKTRNVKVIHP